MGCWSEADVDSTPNPPVPKDDPQIITRPVPELAVNDFAAVRHFRFHYDVTLTNLPPGEMAKIWIPLARDTSLQRVTRELTEVPGTPQVQTEPDAGNVILYTEAEANAQGEIPLKITCIVERVEGVPGGGESVEGAASDASVSPDELRTIYNQLLDEAGKKTELNSTGLALVGSFVNETKLPAELAQVEYGLLLNEGVDRQGAEPTAWARLAMDGRWELVDVLRAIETPRLREHAFGTLSPNRIHLSSGQNVPLIPPAKASSVPRLLLPYVEVAGKPHADLKTAFRFEDMQQP